MHRCLPVSLVLYRSQRYSFKLRASVTLAYSPNRQFSLQGAALGAVCQIMSWIICQEMSRGSGLMIYATRKNEVMCHNFVKNKTKLPGHGPFPCQGKMKSWWAPNLIPCFMPTHLVVDSNTLLTILDLQRPPSDPENFGKKNTPGKLKDYSDLPPIIICLYAFFAMI